jgi:branched-chain amino acid transport system permease protein
MQQLIGIAPQVLFGQLLIGLINGAFYAILSLGLAVIFGLLNIINFTHGAQYMMGAFGAWMMLNYLGLNYWWAIVVVPLVVGAVGVLIERFLIKRIANLDHLYGLLLTFGLALVIQGLFRNEYGSTGLPYQVPPQLAGGQNLGFMFLPNYRAWVVADLARRLPRHLVRDRAHQAGLVPARRDREPDPGPGLRHRRAAHGDAHLRLRRGIGRLRGRARSPDLPGEPADGREPDHRRLRGGGDRRHGLDRGRHRHRLRPGVVEGLTKVFYPEASNTVVFVVMALVLLVKPAGLFGRTA